MGVRILAGHDMACLYDSVTDTAFGRVFYGAEAEERLERFLKWYPGDDPRLDADIGAAQDDWWADNVDPDTGDDRPSGEEEVSP